MIERFEDIEAWQRARQLTKRIYELSGKGGFARDYGLKDQIRRSSVSIMANIAEGYERDGNREFSNFLSVAKGSCGETRSHLYAAFDQGFISKEDFDSTYDHLMQLARMISGFMNYLKTSDIKGRKFR